MLDHIEARIAELGRNLAATQISLTEARGEIQRLERERNEALTQLVSSRDPVLRELAEENRRLRKALSDLRRQIVDIVDSGPRPAKDIIQPLLVIFDKALFVEAESTKAPTHDIEFAHMDEIPATEHDREIAESVLRSIEQFATKRAAKAMRRAVHAIGAEFGGKA